MQTRTDSTALLKKCKKATRTSSKKIAAKIDESWPQGNDISLQIFEAPTKRKSAQAKERKHQQHPRRTGRTKIQEKTLKEKEDRTIPKTKPSKKHTKHHSRRELRTKRKTRTKLAATEELKTPTTSNRIRRLKERITQPEKQKMQEEYLRNKEKINKKASLTKKLKKTKPRSNR